MAAVNVPDSSDNSLTPPPPEGNTTEKGAQRKTYQGGIAKNFPSLSANKQTADQVFHDAPSELAPDSQLQNEVADLERQVLKAKKAAFQKQLQTLTTANPAPPTEEPAANPREIAPPRTQRVLFLSFEPFASIHRSLTPGRPGQQATTSVSFWQIR